MFCKYTPAGLKKELRQAIILEAHPDLPKGKATVTQPSPIEKFLFNQSLQISQPCAVAKSPLWGDLEGLYMMVDFLNSIFSFLIDPGIFPIT
jgi:hypothetical protein